MHKLIFRINNLLFKNYYKWFNKKFQLGSGVVINKWPQIVIAKKASISLGKNVILNSSNRTYHVNMFSPVKLMSDKKGSIIKIGDNTRIHGSCIHAFNRIEIGKNCLIAANCQIFDASGHETNSNERMTNQGKSKPIIIGDNVWIGTGCIILPGTTIGNGSIIAAGSVVLGSIPENSLVGGNPCKIIKTIGD